MIICFCFSVTSRLVAVRTSDLLAALTSRSTPFSASKGEFAGATADARLTACSSFGPIHGNVQRNSSFYATKSKKDSWFSSTGFFFDFFFLRSSNVRCSSPS